MNKPIPVILFAFNRPDKLERVLEALKPQGVEHLIIFVDGPRNEADMEQVEQCRGIAKQVNWAKTELCFGKENRGSYGLKDNISHVFAKHESAIFVEDDCLPMPGFYSFISQALERYQFNARVFSISGYQPIEYKYLKHLTASVVSSPRFTMTGWATWRDRWQFVLPYLWKFWELFRDAREGPDIAGHDLPKIVSWGLGKFERAWDWEVVLTTLWLGKVHILPAKGKILNIGMDGSGLHPGHPTVHNRNVFQDSLEEVTWLEDVEPAQHYIKRLKEFVVRATSPEYVPLKDKVSDKVLAAYWLGRSVAGKAKRAIIKPPRKPEPLRYYDVVLADEAKGKTTRRALLSYLTDRFAVPRSDPRFLQHIVIWHCQEIVRILNRMGYSVDVVSYDDRAFVPRRPYDLFIGHMGINFEQIARALSPHTKKIYLSNTNYWDFHNKQELARFAALKQRRGVDLPLLYDRFLHYPEEGALRAADAIVGFGNTFTRSTYRDFSPVINVNNVVLADNHFERQTKDYNVGRNHFLFYSGPGNVHKGLDLLLEAFMKLDDQHLWICTQIEEQFKAVYQLALYHCPNIHLVGLIQPRSPTYYDLISRCNFTILPSCSDAAAQSVVEGMNQGLIPVISRECTLDVDDFGFYLDPCTIDEIINVVSTAARYSADGCREMSLKAHREAATNCSEAAFSRNMQRALESIVQGNSINEK